MNPLQLTQAYCNDEKRAWKKTFLLNETPAAEEGLVAMKKRASKEKNLSAEQIPCSAEQIPCS